ncbi:MAG: FxsA family protein [Pseudomonadota bacterium]
MPIALILFGLFVGVPLIEVALFVQIGGWIGLWPTLLAIVATALVGSLVIRWQGIEVATKARARLDRGQMPLEEGFTGLCLVVAGLLMITPGFFTDALGALLLLPPVRGALYRQMAKRVHVVGGGPPPGHSPREPDVIDVDFEVVDESEPMPPPKGRWDRPERD